MFGVFMILVSVVGFFICSICMLALMDARPWLLIMPLVIALLCIWRYHRNRPRREAAQADLNERLERVADEASARKVLEMMNEDYLAAQRAKFIQGLRERNS